MQCDWCGSEFGDNPNFTYRWYLEHAEELGYVEGSFETLATGYARLANAARFEKQGNLEYAQASRTAGLNDIQAARNWSTMQKGSLREALNQVWQENKDQIGVFAGTVASSFTKDTADAFLREVFQGLSNRFKDNPSSITLENVTRPRANTTNWAFPATVSVNDVKQALGDRWVERSEGVLVADMGDGRVFTLYNNPREWEHGASISYQLNGETVAKYRFYDYYEK